jgi:DNA-binding winged helix-turn-helix (wHTH) protein
MLVTDVVLVHWPEQRDELPRLAEQRVPRLLLVAPAADPPEAGDILQDWVRLPGDERDVRARLSSLRQRADQETMPVIDTHGRLVHRRLWVQLSPIHERLARRLLAAAEGVVAEQELLDEGWPGGHPSSNALRVHLHRLRRYIRPLGLEIRGVRGEGWVLQRCWPAAVPDDGADTTARTPGAGVGGEAD